MSVANPKIDQLESIYSRLYIMVTQEQLFWKIALGIICACCVYWCFSALRRMRTRLWSAFYFFFLAAAIFLWSSGTLLHTLLPQSSYTFLFLILRQMGTLFVPGLLLLHIWNQVSYKDITWLVVLLSLVVPLLLTPLVFLGHFAASASSSFVFPAFSLLEGLFSVLYYAYIFLALLKGILLCLNVFYQMPPHMRRSSYYLLSGIGLLAVSYFATFLLPLTFDLTLLAAAIMMLCFLDAFFAASSANVIVTSRDFVFGNLSTLILVLSRGRRILDWNKKTPDAIAPLPKPLYREPFERYKARILKDGSGRVSPHGENTITTTHGGVETHYLITIHQVRNKSRSFGFLVEIAEITKIYSMLRHLEDIAMVDQLTNLYNRNAYLSIVRRLVEDAVLPLVVVVGDVNNLKRINDTAGHLIGDALLVAVSGFIRQAAPTGGYACRIGGDEFVLLIPNGTLDIANTFIKNVNDACAETHGESFGTPGVSWGCAIRESEHTDYNDVFARADREMYNTKKSSFHFTSSGMVPRKDTPPKTPPTASAPPPGAAQSPEPTPSPEPSPSPEPAPNTLQSPEPIAIPEPTSIPEPIAIPDPPPSTPQSPEPISIPEPAPNASQNPEPTSIPEPAPNTPQSPDPAPPEETPPHFHTPPSPPTQN